MKKTVDEMLAEAAIREIQIRYCRAVDRMDFALLRSCFHGDATAQYGFFNGDVEAFIAMARVSLKSYINTVHFTGNQLVEVSGRRAWAEHYTNATHRCAADEAGPERDFITAVRYIDELEQRDGDWRIAARTLLLDSWRLDPISGLGGAPEVTRGARDRTDVSYLGRPPV
jgi:hypothetical protein